MRNLLLASAAVMGLALSVPAMAQSASNIDPADTHSTIAPRLPAPPVSEGASPRQFLQAAQAALKSNRTGEAQEALERAEARLLDRSTTNPGQSQRPAVQHVADARAALGHGDVAGTSRIVDAMLAAPLRTQASRAPMAAPGTPSASMASGASSGNSSAIGAMPASGVTAYGNGEVPLPSTDDSMTFSGRSGDNSFTVRARPDRNEDDDLGPGADSAN